MPNGEEIYFCERCKLTVDYVNSFDDEAEGESEEDGDEEETNEPEDEDELQDH